MCSDLRVPGDNILGCAHRAPILSPRYFRWPFTAHNFLNAQKPFYVSFVETSTPFTRWMFLAFSC